MHKFSKQIAAALVVSAFALPIAASAQSTASVTVSSDVQAQIQSLLAQIKTLQEQIKALVASSTGASIGWHADMGSSTMGMQPGQFGKMACITLNRNLHQGDQGDDVKSIQQILKDDASSGFTGNVTGFFGSLTAKAMMHFQMNNGIASSSDGSIGRMTRGFFERHCGKGLDGMQGDRMGNGQNSQGGPGQNGGPGMMVAPGMMAGAVRGTIAANNTSNIAVTTDGGTVTVNITASTSIKVLSGTSTPASGSVSDLAVGKKITAAGTKNSDGSIQAMVILVGDMPSTMGGMMDMVKGMLGPIMNGMMGGDNRGPMMPSGMMPTMNGPQHGPGTNGGPQNW